MNCSQNVPVLHKGVTKWTNPLECKSGHDGTHSWKSDRPPSLHKAHLVASHTTHMDRLFLFESYQIKRSNQNFFNHTTLNKLSNISKGLTSNQNHIFTLWYFCQNVFSWNLHAIEALSILFHTHINRFNFELLSEVSNTNAHHPFT